MHWSTIPSLLLATAIAQVAARDFSRTCSGISYGTTTLRANCQDSRGDGTSADINLTRCLANDNGRLVCRPSSPSFKFCDCGLAADRSVLNCRCTDSTGTKKPTSIDLDSCLSNIDGNLRC